MIDSKNRVVTKCAQCGDWDDHPKVLSNTGWTRHHDCVPSDVLAQIYGGSHGVHPNVTGHIFEECRKGLRGGDLLELINNYKLPDHGAAEMNTSGIDGTMANAFLTALLPGTGTTTIGTVTVTAPIKVRFDSVITTTDTGASTEWSGGSYPAGGVSVGNNWAAAGSGSRATGAGGTVTVTGAPATNWAGNELWDSSGTPLRCLYAAITGGTKVVNSGDTATIANGNLSGTAHGS
jgi:hypothetical protein